MRYSDHSETTARPQQDHSATDLTDYFEVLIVTQKDQPFQTTTGSENELEGPALKWPSDPKSRMRRLEAVLFMARAPMPTRKISEMAELEDGTQARTMIKQLNQHYDQIGRAFHVKRVAGGYQMLTRPQFSRWILKLDHIHRAKRLSNPALETLTVVAYRQPIIKAEIESIRGVSCGEMLRQLLEKGLIKIAGRSEKLGRPFLYATTKDFLARFGFNSLNDLPRSKQLSGRGLPQWATSDENRGPAVNDSESKLSQPQETNLNRESQDSPPKEEEE